MTLSGLVWEPHLRAGTRGRKKVQSWRVRENSLSIHHTWLEHACENSSTHHESCMACQAKKQRSSICWKLGCLDAMQGDVFLHSVPPFTRLRIQSVICCYCFQNFLGDKLSTFFSLCLVIFSIQSECVYLIFQKYTWFTGASFSPPPHHRHHLPLTGCSTKSQICFSWCHYEY